jgi:hypothetical protein
VAGGRVNRAKPNGPFETTANRGRIPLAAPSTEIMCVPGSWLERRALKQSEQPRKKLVLAGITLVLVGWFTARQIATWSARLRYPGEENYIEGIPLAEMVQLRRGVPIYASPSAERFDAAIYGPLYYLLGAHLVSPDKPAYLPLRLVSLTALLGCALACALLAFWIGNSYLAAVLAPLLFVAYDFVNWNGTSVRCDFMALFFSFVGFLIAYRFQNSRALLMAVPLMLLAGFFKQQFIAAPIAVLLFLLVEKRYRLAIQFAGIVVVSTSVLLGFFQFVLFRGQAFLLHFLIYNLMPPSLGSCGDCLVFFGIVLFLPTLMALVFLWATSDRLLACYLGCTVLFSLAATIRSGSDVNYFLECALIISPLLAVLISNKIAKPGAAGWLLTLGAALALGQWRTYFVPGPADFDRDQAEQDYLQRKFPPHTRALGYYSGDLLRAGLETPISDLYIYSRLVRKDMIPDRGLLDQVRNRHFGVIVLSFALEQEKDPWRRERYLTEAMRRAIVVNYQAAGSLEMPNPEKINDTDSSYLWVPRRVLVPHSNDTR